MLKIKIPPKMDIITIDNFFSKTAFADYETAFDEPKWQLCPHITTEKNDGAGVQRHFGGEDGAFHLSLYPAHVISRELGKEYYCYRMRFRVTWPCEDGGIYPHIDDGKLHGDKYDISAVIHMNDSDGDLIIYDSIYPEPFNAEAGCIKFTPRKNRCIIMMKKYWHHPMTPVKTNLRYSVNLNLKEHR